DKTIDSFHGFVLVRHGHVIAECWWAPYAAETPHSLFSLSKSFTSTAVGLAAADGKLSIDDPVLNFLNGRRACGRRREVEHRRPGAQVLPGRRPGRAERQPQGDAAFRPAPHVHRT